MSFMCPHGDLTTPHTTEKYCPACEETLAHTKFHRNKAQPSGLSSNCKQCRKDKRAEPEEREKYNAYMRSWNAEHSEQVQAATMEDYWNRHERRKTDPELDAHLRELSRKRSRRAYARNPSKAVKACRVWEAANSEQVKTTRRKRYAKNPRKYLAHNEK